MLGVWHVCIGLMVQRLSPYTCSRLSTTSLQGGYSPVHACEASAGRLITSSNYFTKMSSLGEIGTLAAFH